MGVLNDIEKMMTQDEISQSNDDYLKKTQSLRDSKESLAKSLAAYIAQSIKEKNISQNELMRSLKISSATMTEIINGRGNPTIETIAKFGAFFGKKPEIKWK